MCVHDCLTMWAIDYLHTKLSIEPDQLNNFCFMCSKLDASSRRGRPWNQPAPEDPAELMGTLREMAYAMREQAVAAHKMMDQLGRQPEVNQGGNLNGPEVDLKYLKFAEFWKANPPSFRGAFDSNKAEEWVKAMEKVFSILACTNHQKVAFATYMFEADAKFWWNSVKRLLEES